MRQRFLTAAAAAAVLLASGCERDSEPTYGENVARALRDGKASGARGDMQSIAMAITSHATQEGNVPDASDIDGLASKLEPTYLRRVPRVDPWGTAFTYSTDGTSWTLGSAGADRRPGTNDDLEMMDGQMTKVPFGRRHQ